MVEKSPFIVRGSPVFPDDMFFLPTCQSLLSYGLISFADHPDPEFASGQLPRWLLRSAMVQIHRRIDGERGRHALFQRLRSTSQTAVSVVVVLFSWILPLFFRQLLKRKCPCALMRRLVEAYRQASINATPLGTQFRQYFFMRAWTKPDKQNGMEISWASMSDRPHGLVTVCSLSSVW